MQDLSLHLLDVAENSVRAGASRVEIRLVEDTDRDELRLEIVDDGVGMDPALCARATSPFVTTRAGKRIGLGLALLRQAAREAEGDCVVESAPGQGTRVVATFRHSHIDRKPLGDIGETLLALAAAHPETAFLLEIQSGGQTQRLDTRHLPAREES